MVAMKFVVHVRWFGLRSRGGFELNLWGRFGLRIWGSFGSEDYILSERQAHFNVAMYGLVTAGAILSQVQAMSLFGIYGPAALVSGPDQLL